MPCLNPECSERASVNYAATNDYRQGLYNCPHCGLRGDAIGLIIGLIGEDLDPHEEMSDKEIVAQAHIWAEQYAGAQPESAVEKPKYTPSWLQE